MLLLDARRSINICVINRAWTFCDCNNVLHNCKVSTWVKNGCISLDAAFPHSVEKFLKKTVFLLASMKSIAQNGTTMYDCVTFGLKGVGPGWSAVYNYSTFFHSLIYRQATFANEPLASQFELHLSRHASRIFLAWHKAERCTHFRFPPSKSI